MDIQNIIFAIKIISATTIKVVETMISAVFGMIVTETDIVFKYVFSPILKFNFWCHEDCGILAQIVIKMQENIRNISFRARNGCYSELPRHEGVEIYIKYYI